MNHNRRYELVEKGLFSELDVHFGGLMQSLDHEENPMVFAAAVLVSSYRNKGHVCLDLSRIKKETKKEWEQHFQMSFPEPENWVSILKQSPVVGTPGDFKPLILDPSSRLYLSRYYAYQEAIVQYILNTSRRVLPAPDDKRLAEGLNRLFPQGGTFDDINFQRKAAAVSVHKQLCIISGGPGTGKTTTVAGILSLLLDLSGKERLSICLAAPTGKSAARLRESVCRAIDKDTGSGSSEEWLPDRAYTIHRMLGISPHTPHGRYNNKNRLPADVVVVDEASMIDISLMAKLLEALRDDTKLILIGDRHQLASVEAGSVFRDICGPADSDEMNRADHGDGGHDSPVNNTRDVIVQLEKSYRFEEGSGISALSKSVKEGKGDQSLSLLHDHGYDDIRIKRLPGAGGIKAAVSDLIVHGYRSYIREERPEDALKAFEEFRVLCALREGPYGVLSLNSSIERILDERGLIRADGEWYHGRPVIITGNDYNLRLFNGDTGIALKDPEPYGPDDKQSIYVFFNSGDGMRKIHPNRLSSYETAYAITIHKSQGSEYERVLIVLPDREMPILTREMIYTAITRAKSQVVILSDDTVFMRGVANRIERTSGLFDSLWGEHSFR